MKEGAECEGNQANVFTMASCFWPPPHRCSGCPPWERKPCWPNCDPEAPSRTGWVAPRSPCSASPGVGNASPTRGPPAGTRPGASADRPCTGRRSGSPRRYSALRCGLRALLSAGSYPPPRRSARREEPAESRAPGCGNTRHREAAAFRFCSHWRWWCTLCCTESADGNPRQLGSYWGTDVPWRDTVPTEQRERSDAWGLQRDLCETGRAAYDVTVLTERPTSVLLPGCAAHRLSAVASTIGLRPLYVPEKFILIIKLTVKLSDLQINVVLDCSGAISAADGPWERFYNTHVGVFNLHA